MKQLSVDSGQLSVGGRQVVFEPEFDPEALHFVIEIDDEDFDYEHKVIFFESGTWAHSSNLVFEFSSEAYLYAKDVIARYKRMIAAAELAFILNDDHSDLLDQFDHPDQLDPDYLKVIKAADEPKQPAKG